MALSAAQRAIVARSVKASRKGPDTSGGEAYRQWKDDPRANWLPSSGAPDGAQSSVGPGAQSFPIPPASKKNKFWRGKPKPIPNSVGRPSGTQTFKNNTNV